jgi:hypothetical protein
MRIKIAMVIGFALMGWTAWSQLNDESDPDAPITAVEAKKEAYKALSDFMTRYKDALQDKAAIMVTMCHELPDDAKTSKKKKKLNSYGEAVFDGPDVPIACKPLNDALLDQCHPVGPRRVLA